MDHQLSSSSLLLSIVHKWQELLSYIYFIQQLLHFTASGLSNIEKQTILELFISLDILVCSNLVLNLGSELMLVSEHILDLALVDWHALLVSIVHGPLLVEIVVLCGESLIFRDLGKLL